MKIIKPYVYIKQNELTSDKLANIEYAARLCYKSENKMEVASSANFLLNIVKNGHESVIEHEKVTVCMVTDRGVTHEIVRHRVGSYSQESTRYCNYAKDKFGNELTFIEPFFYLSNSNNYNIWKSTCQTIEENYLALIATSTAQEARTILPNSLKTEIMVTYNLREWRHFFTLRCAKESHPQMQQITIPLLIQFKKSFAPLFDDVPYNLDFPAEHYAEIVIKN